MTSKPDRLAALRFTESGALRAKQEETSFWPVGRQFGNWFSLRSQISAKWPQPTHREAPHEIEIAVKEVVRGKPGWIFSADLLKVRLVGVAVDGMKQE